MWVMTAFRVEGAMRSALDKQGSLLDAVHSAQSAYHESITPARTAAALALREVCERQEVPALEKVAWSATFWAGFQTTAGAEAYAADAARRYDRLTEIDDLLRTPGTPIVRITNGRVSAVRERDTFGVVCNVSDGTGLHVMQHVKSEPTGLAYYHRVSAGRKVSRSGAGAVIADVDPNELLSGCEDPEVMANTIANRDRSGRDPAFFYVIGAAAIQKFLTQRHVAPGTKMTLVIGHLAEAGFGL